jgi:RHS repeat-associated protein
MTGFYGYDAFGNLAFGTATSPFGYAGQYLDATTSFSDMRARPYSSQTGGFTLRDPAFSTTDTAYSYAGEDPVNGSDPFGLWGWNLISDVTQAAKDVGHYVVTHKRDIEIGVGIGLGVLSAGIGAGAIIAGATATGFFLGAGSVALGIGADVLDYGPCVSGHSGAACVGLGLGATGALTGTLSTAGAGLVLAEVISDDSLTSAILGGFGAFGWNFGVAGTIVDASAAAASAASLQQCYAKL